MRIRSIIFSSGLLAACGAGAPNETDLMLEPLDKNEAFLPIYREDNQSAVQQMQSALQQTGGPKKIADTFYLAINKKELGQRWFLSAFSQQFFPGAVGGGAAFSLGTRVISFKVQNNKLFVFDVDTNKKTSDTFDPEVLVEAYPIVTNRASFDNRPNASDFILFDPAAGLNRFGALSDSFAAAEVPSHFIVELAFSQRFRKLQDGYTYDQVYTGYSDLADPQSAEKGDPNKYRASGTLGIALRRYSEGHGYVATPLPEHEHYFRSDPKIVPNQGIVSQVAAKWNIHEGMKPIRWLISDKVKHAETHPIHKNYNVLGAIKAGIENWNEAFGFKVLEAAVATAEDNFSDDDNNYLIYDEDPSFGAAFANWRTNPNTGEIRGASVYFNTLWLDAGDEMFSDDPKPLPLLETGKVFRPSFTWGTMRSKPLCILTPQEMLADWESHGLPFNSGISKKEKVERFVSHVVLHEIGHTLSLRHNFKGSLVPHSSSVMEYVDDAVAFNVDKPQSYDTAAIRYLYGLSKDLPSDPFCTDEQTVLDPDCTRFDVGTNPLVDSHQGNYNRVVQSYLSNVIPPAAVKLYDSRYDRTLNSVLGYVRASTRADQRLEAWKIAVNPLQVPLTVPPGANADYVEKANVLIQRLFKRLYIDPVAQRGSIRADVPQDSALQRAIIAELKANLLNGDKLRTFATRRVGVDTLKKMQTTDAYTALLETRDALRAQRPTLTGTDAIQTDDLLARIQKAIEPYFD